MCVYVCFNLLFIACTVKSVSTVDAAVQVNYLAIAEGSGLKYCIMDVVSYCSFACNSLSSILYRLPAWSRGV